MITNQEYGPIYSPNVRSKCFRKICELIEQMGDEDLKPEYVYAYKMSKFYERDRKDILFLVDSTQELNSKLIDVWGLIKGVLIQLGF